MSVAALLQGTLIPFSTVSSLPVVIRASLLTGSAFVPGESGDTMALARYVIGASDSLPNLRRFTTNLAVIFLVACVLGAMLMDRIDHFIDADDTPEDRQVTVLIVSFMAAVAGGLVATAEMEASEGVRPWKATVGGILADMAIVMPLAGMGMAAGRQMRSPSAPNLATVKYNAGLALAAASALMLGELSAMALLA